MSDIANRIDELLKKKGVTGYRMCSELKMSRSFLTELRKGRAKGLSLDTASKIADYFGVSVNYLLGQETATIPERPAPTRPGSQWIPVLGSVIAGSPLEAIEEILDWEEIDAKTVAQGVHFALKIKGDSMEPALIAGDVVIVRKQPTADNGDTVVALVNGDEATVKRIKKRPDGLMLIPNNPAYEPMYYTNEEAKSLPVEVIGKVIELRRML